MPDLLRVTEHGLYCDAAGGTSAFHIDPWKPVERAVITHAHSDHARPGAATYLCAEPSAPLLRLRLGKSINLTAVPYGQPVSLGDVKISFHPAGHILGSAQARVEHKGEVWTAAGDYKRDPDPTCAPFEPVRCHTFITESTFALPIYRWKPPAHIFTEINQWWTDTRALVRTAVIFAYTLGKAQRLLAGVDASIGPILGHGALIEAIDAYAEAGVTLPTVHRATRQSVKDHPGALVIAPPAAAGSAWLDSLGETSTAYASGWMQVRGRRRWQSADRGFVLSDHADWPALLRTIADTGATRILATHGSTAPFVRFLRERGLDADTLATPYSGERDAAESDDPPETAAPTVEGA